MLKREDLNQVLRILRNISINNNNMYLNQIETLEKIIDENLYKVAVIGEFSSGKSTFLNALIGKRVLYSSNNEATGTITYIQSDEEKRAQVIFEDEDYEEVDINNNSEFETLKAFIDIKRKGKEVKKVGISYPLLGIDKEIQFIDTPGLQGINKKQMLMTRDILKEANATIMLITKKGLSETEKNILAGKNTEFGRINTKDVLLVINKIGQVYDGKDEKEALEKIESIKEEVIKELKGIGADNVNIFTLDSRDYLWSNDDSLYQEKKDENFLGLLSQEEYKSRSNFEYFKKYLMNFLEEGERNKNFLLDIEEKLYLIIDGFLEVFSDNSKENTQYNKQIIEQLHRERELLLKNKKKLYNSLIRFMSNSLKEFYKNAEKDISNLEKERNKLTAKIIDKNLAFSIIKKEIDIETINTCNEEINQLIKKDISEMESKLFRYQKILINQLVNQKVRENVTKNFKKDIEFKLDIESKDVNIDLKVKSVKLNENDIISDLETEIKDLERSIYKLRKKIDDKEIISLKDQLKNISFGKKQAREKYTQEKNRLGNRPRPVQRYRSITKTKGILFWKKTYTERVPDGLDDSNVKEWEKRSQAITNQYLKATRDKEEEIFKIERRIEEYNRLKEEITKLDYEKEKLKVEKREYEIKRLEKERKNQKKALDNQKMTLYNSFLQYEKNQYKSILDGISENIYKINKYIKEQIHKELEKNIDIFEKELNEEIEKIQQELYINNSSIKETYDELNTLKERLI